MNKIEINSFFIKIKMESYFPARFLHVKIEALKHELFVVDCQKLSMKTYSNLRQYLSHEKKTIIEYDTLKFRDVCTFLKKFRFVCINLVLVFMLLNDD